MKLAFLGFGEAASSIALGLHGEGLDQMKAFDVLLSDPAKKEKALNLIEKSGAQAAWSVQEAATDADLILSAVPADFAASTAESAAPFVKSGSLYVDVTTASPGEKQKMAAIIEEKGAKFCDAAMLGPLLQYKHKVPMLLSGSGSEAFRQLMEPYHMDLTVVEGAAGVATSIKFIRSISAKGIACILYETLQAAQYFHVEDMIVDSLCESYGKSFEKVIDGYVSGTCIHARRREHEMQNVEDMLKEAGLPCSIVTATKEKLADIAQMDIPSRFENGVPRNWRGVLAGWKVND